MVIKTPAAVPAGVNFAARSDPSRKLTVYRPAGSVYSQAKSTADLGGTQLWAGTGTATFLRQGGFTIVVPLVCMSPSSRIVGIRPEAS